jgi:hypothetical protein
LARVNTDHTTYPYFDETIRRFSLTTRDAQAFYTRFGSQPLRRHAVTSNAWPPDTTRQAHEPLRIAAASGIHLTQFSCCDIFGRVLPCAYPAALAGCALH